MKPTIALLTYFLIPFSLISAKDYNIKDYGAIADGKTLTNEAFNNAIETAFNNGGGRVIVPKGEYLCGSIRMKSNTELHFEEGAKIIAAPEKYQAYDQREPWEGPQYQDGGHTSFTIP